MNETDEVVKEQANITEQQILYTNLVRILFQKVIL